MCFYCYLHPKKKVLLIYFKFTNYVDNIIFPRIKRKLIWACPRTVWFFFVRRKTKKYKTTPMKLLALLRVISWMATWNWAYWKIPTFSRMWGVSNQQNPGVLQGVVEAYLVLSFDSFPYRSTCLVWPLPYFFRFVFTVSVISLLSCFTCRRLSTRSNPVL